MLWKGRQKSGNIEDRRGMSGGKKLVGGSIGTIAIVVIVLLLGGNPNELLNNLQIGTNEQAIVDPAIIQAETELADFTAVVLKDTEDVWHQLFRENGMTYREPKLVLFSGSVESACGYAASATGPFYCPGDEKLYIDLSFLDELQQRLGAQGDFAMAYIIAHEVGHHVQKQLGLTEKLDQMRGRVDEVEYNRNLVKLELQADFLAGIWAHHAQRTKNILEEGDVDEAINAAAAVGDDRIQMQSQGYVVPDAFTHGTSEQRKSHFLKGFRSGDINQGIDFSEN
jgi:predicted metalloprotease